MADGLAPLLAHPVLVWISLTALVMLGLSAVQRWRWARRGAVRQVPVHAVGGRVRPWRVGPLAHAVFTDDAVHCGPWNLSMVAMRRDQVRAREVPSPCALVPLPCVELSDGRRRIVLWRDAATVSFLRTWCSRGACLGL